MVQWSIARANHPRSGWERIVYERKRKKTFETEKFSKNVDVPVSQSLPKIITGRGGKIFLGIFYP
jgi:hypothetical protein